MTQGRAFDNYRSGADGYFGVLVMPWKAIESTATATNASGQRSGAETDETHH